MSHHHQPIAARAVFALALVASVHSQLNQWQSATVQDSVAMSAAFSSCSSLHVQNLNKHFMIVYGGIAGFSANPSYDQSVFSNLSTFSSDMWLFDPQILVWIPVARANNMSWPAARAAHASAALQYGTSNDSAIVIFGGTNGSLAFGDTWLFYFQSDKLVYTQALAQGSPSPGPAPRWAHSMVVFSGSVYLFGGFGASVSGPALPDPQPWRLDISAHWSAAGPTSGAWTALAPSGTPPSPRGFFYMMPYGGSSLAMAFGWNHSFSTGALPLRDTVVLELAPSPAWRTLGDVLPAGINAMAAGGAASFRFANADVPLVSIAVLCCPSTSRAWLCP